MTARDLFFDGEAFYKDIHDSNERWQATNAARIPVEERVIRDVNDGTEWEKHEYLGAADFGGEKRLAFTAYADDVDIPNPIGAASGHHKMTFIYTVCLNRDPTERTRLAHINLASIILSKDLKEFTPEICVSGHEGEAYNSSSLGASLRRFQDGVNLQVNNGADQSVRSEFYRGWLFSFVGDAPAVGEMVGTKAAFSKAKNPCNMCENANRPAIYAPTRWLPCHCENDRHNDETCCCEFALRTAERDAEHKAGPPDADKLQRMGVNTWEHAFIRVPSKRGTVPSTTTRP